jgi:hypothetical protein
VVGGGPYCDGGMISTRVERGAPGSAVRAWMHLSNNGVEATSEGYGVRSKVRGSDGVSLTSDDYLAKNYGNFHTAVSYALPKKIENGSPGPVGSGWRVRPSSRPAPAASSPMWGRARIALQDTTENPHSNS